MFIHANSGARPILTPQRGEVSLEGLPTYGTVCVTASFGTREGKIVFGAKVERATLTIGQEHRYN